MSVSFSRQVDGAQDTIFVEVSGECKASGDIEVITEATTPLKVLKLAAEIIDSSSFYKDIFDGRVF